MSIDFSDLFPEIDFTLNENDGPNSKPFTSAFGVATQSGHQNHHLIATGEANRSPLLKILDFFGKEEGKGRNPGLR